MRIIRFFILLAIVFLIVWAYLQKNPYTWKEPPIPPALKSSFDQLRIWSKENAPQLQEELEQLLHDMTQRAEENPELLQSAINTGVAGMTTDSTAALAQPTVLALDDLPKEDVIRTIIQKLKESKNFDLAARWENLAENSSRMTGEKQKEDAETK